MKQRIQAILAHPVTQHLQRAITRFTERNGSLLAAAITYFSVLSLVPVLMFFFAAFGFVMTVFLSDLLDDLKSSVLGALGGGQIAEAVAPMIDKALSNWASIEVVAAVFALGLWSGTAWVGNLRSAVQAMWLEDPVADAPSRNPVVEFAANLGVLLLFLLATFATVVVSTIATLFNAELLGWLGLSEVPGLGLLFGALGLLITLLCSTGLFCFLFRVLPGQRAPRGYLLRGSLLAGIGLTALQSLAGLVAKLFSGNVSAAVFGPAIIMMLFFNLYATITMLVAAWIGTAIETAPEAEQDGDAPEGATEPAEPRLGPWPQRATGKLYSPDEPGSHPVPDPNVYVPQDVAARGVRIGAGLGYGLGALTGAGLGALLAALTRGMFRRK
ncbi:MAG: YhjD/YihY/BrkB family envelope integrity protein [Propionibacteriaceae bacterium]|nr:YhjD/YihY/BrkB family envelope integrity protein [Propionibacteriaceae bacterium]